MRVAVIGLGAVGEACAHLLAGRGTARSLVLANRSRQVADAVRMDLEQSRSWTAPLSARAVAPWEPGVFQGCDVIVLTAGSRLRGSEKRPEKAAAAARLLLGAPGESLTAALTRHAEAEQSSTWSGPKSVLLVVTNPVEATVTWLAEKTGWARRRIVGLGTTVDTARFSRVLADRLNVDASSVWTELIGEHGDVIDVRDRDSLERRIAQLGAGPVDVDYLLNQTRAVPGEIRALSEQFGRLRAERLISRLKETEVLPPELEAKMTTELAFSLSPPATRFAIAAAVVAVIEAMAKDSGQILPVSGFAVPALAGLPDVALALPFVVGRAGLLARGLDTAGPVLVRAAESIAAQVEVMRQVH